MGNTCKPMAVSFQCMTKSTTNKEKKIYIYKKIISDSHKCFAEIKQELQEKVLGWGCVDWVAGGGLCSEMRPAVWRAGS